MNIYPPGTRIAGRYEIAGRPLIGGMGIVYLCLDHEEQRPVALKTFKPQYLPDRAARDRFLREGTAWVDLGAHPHVVRCYEVLYIDPEVYLVLELVAKEQGREDASLRSWLTPSVPLPVEQALLFALQIARGMAHATATMPGFVHRDLKPENVLVGADHLSQARVNRVRVTDFGLAAVLQEASQPVGETAPDDKQGPARDPLSRTQLTHGIVGTPLYMAPEQWKGERVDVQTDVYALGCMLYEMVAGQRAVVGNSLESLRRAHCQGEVRPLPQDLSATVGEVMARCLALEPGERYESWEAVEAALVTAYEEGVGHPAPAAELVAALSRAERVAAGWSYSAMGLSYQDIGKAEVAAGYFERAREVGEAEGERELEGAALGNLGEAYRNLGEARRAIGSYEQALVIAREIGNRRYEAASLNNLGLAYAGLGDVRHAIGLIEQALAIVREIGDLYREGEGLNDLGSAHISLGDIQRAITCYEQALAIAREVGDRRNEQLAQGNLGTAYLILGNTQRAVNCYEQQLEIARKFSYWHGEVLALGNLGICYRRLGDLQRAIAYYEESLRIARGIGDRRGEVNALGNLGTAYGQIGDARQAVGYYEQTLSIAREIGDRRGEALGLSGLGNVYLNLGDARRAVAYFEQCLAIHRETSDKRGEGNTLGNLGSTYAALGDARQAIGYFKQALAIGHETGDVMGIATASFNMALLHLQQGELEWALPLAQQTADIFARIGSPYTQQVQQLIAQIRAALR